MKAHTVVSFLFAGALSAPALADAPYVARGFNPAHADLPRSAGVPAQLANEDYVKALARIVYYWAYPARMTTNRRPMRAAGTARRISMVRSAPTRRTLRRPIRKRGSIAKGRARRPSSASWGMR